MTKEAIAQFSEALSLKPNDRPAHYNLGLALAEQGSLEEAAAQFTEALRANPQDPLALYNLGIVHEKLGRLEDAVAEFEAALRINPNFAEARKKLENVKKSSGFRVPS